MGPRPVTGRIIETHDDVAEGVAHLTAICPRMAHAYAQTGPLPLRRKPDGFAELLSAIVSQQVSTASAAAIWGRMKTAGLTGPRKIKWASDDDLRAVGLSRQKIRYARALSDAGINFKALRDAPTDAVITTLTQVPGIGTWTAEIYAMFSLGRADVFAPATSPCKRLPASSTTCPNAPATAPCETSPRRGAHGDRLQPASSGPTTVWRNKGKASDDPRTSGWPQGPHVGHDPLRRRLPARLRRQQRRPSGLWPIRWPNTCRTRSSSRPTRPRRSR